MPEYTNATITKKANIYFDGKVTSRTVVTDEGERVTLGIMLPGEYNFDTVSPETMEIQAGELDVMLPDKSTWVSFTAGKSFRVPGNSQFHLKVKSTVDYICHYH
jgi:uncharacterized protein YaiE (UPF0345 family)